MAQHAGGSDPAEIPPRAVPGEDGNGEGARLLRCSHIFASAIREIMEVKLLGEVSPCQLTLSQFHLLKLMSFDGHHQLGELADFLGVTPPAVTKNVDKLERLGLVVRNPSKGDRRATLLSASAKGRRLVRKYEDLKAERMRPVLEGFRPEELAQLAELIERFAVSLLSREQPGPGFCLRCASFIEKDCPIERISGGCPYAKARRAHSGEGVDEDVS